MILHYQVVVRKLFVPLETGASGQALYLKDNVEFKQEPVLMRKHFFMKNATVIALESPKNAQLQRRAKENFVSI